MKSMEAQRENNHERRMRRLVRSGVGLMVLGAGMALALPEPHNYVGLGFNLIGVVFVATWIHKK